MQVNILARNEQYVQGESYHLLRSSAAGSLIEVLAMDFSQLQAAGMVMRETLDEKTFVSAYVVQVRNSAGTVIAVSNEALIE